ncbi:MAG: FG-GAP-like repeat-containing protein [Acidobacteriota bacterium]|nr:FG-GAP-like repeat-containing protein [Acidobacteriota bacterium]
MKSFRLVHYLLLAVTAIATGAYVGRRAAAQPNLPDLPPIVTRETAGARVSTLADLKIAIAAGVKVIWIENTSSIDLGAVVDDRAGAPDSIVQIPPGVTLASGRSETVAGGMLYVSRRTGPQPYMLSLGEDARVTGLRLRGPSASTQDDHSQTTAILVRGTGAALIDRNEISFWPSAAVDIQNATNGRATADRIRVTNNFVHHNLMCGAGYGVVVGTKGYAKIDRNVFNYNRHSVADDGQPATGYIAELNFVLAGGATCPGSRCSHYEQHFDVHGTGSGCPGGVDHCGGAAGEYFAIRNNAIRGDQRYCEVGIFGLDLKSDTRAAFWLRGTPSVGAFFSDNSVAHPDQGAALRNYSSPDRLHVKNIQYGVDTSSELAVGDFDGDGYSDVFQATGAVWVFSPRGQREWRFLNQSSIRLSRLRFGDFDGDGKTDVFTQEGDRWLVSYGGVGPWTPLPAGSNIDMSTYRFADFDGDRKTDVFRANGSQWYYSSGGATEWRPLAVSSLRVDALRFGDFDGDGKADVFAIVNNQWSVSYGGRSSWQRLNAKLSSNLAELVFADFDGDGRTDIARSRGGLWEASWGGRTPWTTLVKNATVPLPSAFLGNFNGDRHATALFYGRSNAGLIHFLARRGGSLAPTLRSIYEMR